MSVFLFRWSLYSVGWSSSAVERQDRRGNALWRFICQACFRSRWLFSYMHLEWSENMPWLIIVRNCTLRHVSRTATDPVLKDFIQPTGGYPFYQHPWRQLNWRGEGRCFRTRVPPKGLVTPPRQMEPPNRCFFFFSFFSLFVFPSQCSVVNSTSFFYSIILKIPISPGMIPHDHGAVLVASSFSTWEPFSVRSTGWV